MERYVCLQPEYVSRFRCDGRRCQSKCCRNWGVNLDGTSLKKYQSIGEPGVREGILSRVREGEGGSLYFELRENGWCPFLREDWLCRLQRELGESYLSCTCRTFPRVVYLLGDALERSLSLACPVAAELILSGEEPLGFEQVEVAAGEPIVVRRPQDSELLDYLPEIQYACISLLQDRSFSLDGRLALLGSFLEQVQELKDSEEMEHLGRLVGFYTADAIAEEGRLLLRAVRFQPERFAGEMLRLSESILAEERKWNMEDRPLRRFLEIAGGRGELRGRAYARAREALLERHGNMLEHYLVNEFFLNIYPFRIKGTLLQNFRAFATGYKLLEILLAFRERESSMAGEELREFLVEFAYRMDHGAAYMENITKRALAGEESLASLLNGLLCGGDSG